jgi:hypothetical protein
MIMLGDAVEIRPRNQARKSGPRLINGWPAKPPGGPKSIFFKGHGLKVLPMPVRAHHIATILALALAGFALGGCASINEKLGAGAGDYIPQWAGGLPRDVPPRRGTPEYDAYMKEQERKRLEPAANANAAAPSPTSSAPSLDPVH